MSWYNNGPPYQGQGPPYPPQQSHSPYPPPQGQGYYPPPNQPPYPNQQIPPYPNHQQPPMNHGQQYGQGGWNAPPGPPPGQHHHGHHQHHHQHHHHDQQQQQQQWGPPPGQQGYGPSAAPPSIGYIPGQMPQMDMGRAADELREAMKGFGTDEKTLIRVLACLTPLELNGTKAAFQARHHRDLAKDVHSETSGHFREGCMALVRGPLEQDCHVVHNAIKGIGTKETALDDVLLCRSNADLHAIKAHYQHMYHRSLESDVKGDLSMKTERLFDMVLAARRNEESTPVIPQQTDADVQEIYRATEGRSGTDQMTVCSIFTSRSNGQIRAISHAYHQRYRRSLEEVIRKEFSGHMEDALLFILRRSEDPAKHDADQLEATMRGAGTKDSALIRRIVEIHWDQQRLHQAKAAYKHFYHRELADRIRSETSGDYEKLLLACIGAGLPYGR